jgi:hypothetical protein
LGIFLITGISLSADPPVLSRAEFEKQLADAQARDQKLREQIAAEQASILDIKKKIDNSRKNIDDIRLKKLEVLGITSDDVETTSRIFDQFIQDVSASFNRPDAEFLNDSQGVRFFINSLDTLLRYPACRLKALGSRTQTATELVNACSQRLQKLISAVVSESAQKKPAASAPSVVTAVASPETQATGSAVSSNGPATYVVRSTEGGKTETLYSIAQQVYGNAYLWTRIYLANKKDIDKNFDRFRNVQKRNRIAGPSDLIYPGQVLVIPR